MLRRPAVVERIGGRVEHGVVAARFVETVETRRHEPQAQGFLPGSRQVDLRAERFRRGGMDAQRGEPVEVVFGLVPQPGAAGIGQAVREGAVQNEAAPIADAARDPGEEGGGLARAVGMELDQRIGLHGPELLCQGRDRAGVARGGQRDEAVQQRMFLQERAHRLAGDEDDALTGPLLADRLQAGSGDDDIAHAVGSAEEEHGGRRKTEGRKLPRIVPIKSSVILSGVPRRRRTPPSRARALVSRRVEAAFRDQKRGPVVGGRTGLAASE